MKIKVTISDFPFYRQIKNSTAEFVRFYEDPTLYDRVMRFLRIHVSNRVDGSWIDKIKSSEIIVLFDTLQEYAKEARMIEDICRPSCRLVFYAWNPITYSKSFDDLSDRWEKYTFSRKDSLEYGIKYKGPFYFCEPTASEVPIKRDGLFVGLEKGRKNALEAINHLYVSAGFSPDIQIVDNIRALYRRKYSFYKSYEEVCRLIQESRSVIEVLQPGQDGVSLRTMESLFFQKKLITNNISIIENDFYNPENIFIYGKDNPSEFREFLLSPYKKLEPETIFQYKFENWLSNLLN